MELVLPPYQAVNRLLLMLCLGAPAAALAQAGPAAAPLRRPGWLRGETDLNAQAVKLTRAEIAITVNRLKEIERILLQIPELANPKGFEVRLSYAGGGVPASVGDVIASGYHLMFFAPSLKVAGEGSACIQVHVNHRFGGVAGTPYSNTRGPIYFAHPRGDPIPGTFGVWDRLLEAGRSWTYVWLTAGGASPWQPVSREAMLTAAIEHVEGKDEKVLATLRRARSETGYRRWLAEAPQRKAGWDAVTAALPAAEAAKMRKQFEQVERETTEGLKAGETSELEEIDRELARITQSGNGWRARIAAMSPAERSAPAWLDRMDANAAAEFQFVEPESAMSFQVLQEIPGFLKARRSRVEGRSIIVRLSTSLTCETPEVHRAVWQTYKKLDWAALARLLEAGPQ